MRRIFELGHISSFQSRNPDEEKWGGAVLIKINGQVWGISVSGLKENEDEQLALSISHCVSGIDIADPQVQEIVKISQNHDGTKKMFDYLDGHMMLFLQR